MTSLEDARYRLRLAQEHLEDAEFEFQHGRWSKAALSAQLSVENSAKSVIALTSYGDEVALKTPSPWALPGRLWIMPGLS
ncbi:MAG: HEPN domain-containing protein [Deltaproteobacteria bacterium]|nr:HEPN domain-containing protein [Deltaproteobacteria bacterium]